MIRCNTSAQTTSSGVGLDSATYFITGDSQLTSNASGGFVTNVYSFSAVGAANDSFFIVECTGDAP